ncbi:MAG TPA: hypothetical protein VIV12_29780 [Streptosporangiaceae bacterium]
MARYTGVLTSGAALAADTGFAWWQGSATSGGLLRRVIVGVRNTTAATAVTDFQCRLGIARCTNAGTTAGGAVTLNPNMARFGTARTTLSTTFATPPTLQTPDTWQIPFNAKSGVDIPAEFLEEFEVAKLTTDGFAFINRSGAMPAAHVFDLFMEIEE